MLKRGRATTTDAEPAPAASTRRKILFHHIPKTAGTALIERACRVFGDAVCPARYDGQLTEAVIADDRYTFYHGHFSQAAVAAFRRCNPNAFLFTFLRHPYPRVLSQYHNWTDRERVEREFRQMETAQPGDARIRMLHRKFRETILAMSLDEFLASKDPDVSHVASNMQAQYLTADAPPDHARFHHAVPGLLLRYDFVGLQELYAPCLRILETKCGLPWGSLGGSVRANTSDAAKRDGCYTVSRKQLRKLEGRNAYDLALFYTVFAQLYRSYGDMLPPIEIPIEDLIGVGIA